MKLVSKVFFRLGKNQYKSFVKKLKKAFGGNGLSVGGRRLSWSSPVQADQSDSVVVDIFLYCGEKGSNYNKGIRLRVTGFDLYLRGFQKMGDKKWYVFEKCECYFLDAKGEDIVVLPYKENYRDLGGPILGRMGYFAVKAAICGLFDSEDPSVFKQHLVTLILFTSEAVRSPEIATQIKEMLKWHVDQDVSKDWED